MSALIEQQLSFWLLAIYPQKFPAKFAQTHIFSAIFDITLTCVFISLTLATFSVAFIVTIIIILILGHTHDVINATLFVHSQYLSNLWILGTIFLIILLGLLRHINVLFLFSGLPVARNRYRVSFNNLIWSNLIKRRISLIFILPTVWKYTWLRIPYLGLRLHWFHLVHLEG